MDQAGCKNFSLMSLGGWGYIKLNNVYKASEASEDIHDRPVMRRLFRYSIAYPI